MIGVVDASALIRLFIPDGPMAPGLEALLQGAEQGNDLALAPQLLLAEAGNVILRKVRRGELTFSEGGELLDLVGRLPLRLVTHDAFMRSAFELAHEEELSVYDAIYLALAIHHGARLFTCDDRLRKVANRREVG